MMDERRILGKGNSRYTEVVWKRTWQVQTRKSKRKTLERQGSTGRWTPTRPGRRAPHLPAHPRGPEVPKDPLSLKNNSSFLQPSSTDLWATFCYLKSKDNRGTIYMLILPYSGGLRMGNRNMTPHCRCSPSVLRFQCRRVGVDSSR